MFIKSNKARYNNSYTKNGGASRKNKSSSYKANSSNESQASKSIYKKKNAARNQDVKGNMVKKRKKQTLLKKVTKKTKAKLKKGITSKWNDIKEINFKYDPANSKVFSKTCNLMTLSIVLLCSLFVYLEKSLLYAFPLVTVLYIFIKKGKGNRYKDYSEIDLLLYKKIILINLFILSIIYFYNYEDLWFVNIFIFSIFLVPLWISKIVKE